MKNFSDLLELARHLGAGDATLIEVKDIVVRDELARLCLEPRCDGYGRSMSCPPQVAGPQGFRKLMPEYKQALVFKLEVPKEVAFSFERNEVLALIHEIGAGVEKVAREQGAVKARAFAGGSCKELFCADYPECRVLDEGKPCRNSHLARPSMSGHGIDVGKLMETAGWSQRLVVDKAEPMATFTGLVLLE